MPRARLIERTAWPSLAHVLIPVTGSGFVSGMVARLSPTAHIPTLLHIVAYIRHLCGVFVVRGRVDHRRLLKEPLVRPQPAHPTSS